MSASPAATPETRPLALTAAILPFDEDQLAAVVTGFVAPSDSVAVAENCAVAPTRGADPETAIETTAAGADVFDVFDEGTEGEPAHASSRLPAAAPASIRAPQRAAHRSGIRQAWYGLMG